MARAMMFTNKAPSKQEQLEAKTLLCSCYKFPKKASQLGEKKIW
jgi:hypothetical protein